MNGSRCKVQGAAFSDPDAGSESKGPRSEYRYVAGSREPPPTPNLEPCTLNPEPCQPLLLDGRRLVRVEAADDFGGQVEAGVGPDRAGVGDVDQHVQPLLAGDLLQDRVELLLEVGLQLVLQLLELRVCVLLG